MWKIGFFKGKIVLIYSFAIFVLLVILNCTSLVTNGYIDYTNGTEKVVCYAWYNYDFTIFDLLGKVNNSWLF